jgi:thioredoxin-dependent peroxiredoxin
MEERSRLVTMRGNPVTLTGQVLKIGDTAPDFEVTGNDMKPVKFSSFSGKVCIISAVPSLDTPVCDMETRRFNKEAAGLGSDVVILTISMDLPFAQKRWCGAAGVDRVITLSDYKTGGFGTAYGVLMKESRLLARALFVTDKRGVIRYIEIVKEIAQEPDYSGALEAVKRLEAFA